MRPIDADELKTIKSIQSADFNSIESIQRWIDNAPTVPLPDFKEGYKQAIIDGKTNFSRPHREWKRGFICALDKAFSEFDANCTYSGDRVLQKLEKLKEEADNGKC